MIITKADAFLYAEPDLEPRFAPRTANPWFRSLLRQCRLILERSTFSGRLFGWWADRQIKTHGLGLLAEQSAVTASDVALAVARRFGFDEGDAGVMYALRLRCVDVLKACERRGLIRFAPSGRGQRVTRRWALNRSHPDFARGRAS